MAYFINFNPLSLKEAWYEKKCMDCIIYCHLFCFHQSINGFSQTDHLNGFHTEPGDRMGAGWGLETLVGADWKSRQRENQVQVFKNSGNNPEYDLFIYFKITKLFIIFFHLIYVHGWFC